MTASPADNPNRSAGSFASSPTYRPVTSLSAKLPADLHASVAVTASSPDIVPGTTAHTPSVAATNHFQDCARPASLADGANGALNLRAPDQDSAGGPLGLGGTPCRPRAWAARDCSQPNGSGCGTANADLHASIAVDAPSCDATRWTTNPASSLAITAGQTTHAVPSSFCSFPVQHPQVMAFNFQDCARLASLADDANGALNLRAPSLNSVGGPFGLVLLPAPESGAARRCSPGSSASCSVRGRDPVTRRPVADRGRALASALTGIATDNLSRSAGTFASLLTYRPAASLSAKRGTASSSPRVNLASAGPSAARTQAAELGGAKGKAEDAAVRSLSAAARGARGGEEAVLADLHASIALDDPSDDALWGTTDLGTSISPRATPSPLPATRAGSSTEGSGGELLATDLHATPATASRVSVGLIEQSKSTRPAGLIPAGIKEGEAI